MNQGTRTSFRRYSLRHEWLAASAGAVLLIGAGAVSLEVLRGRYLELQRAEANRVKHHLQVHIDEAHKQLEGFLSMPPEVWPQQAKALLPSFSDLYELDDQHKVRQLIKASPGSRVFQGFSFAGSAIGANLELGAPGGRRSTPILRGLEDELTSVYVRQLAGERRLLGRIQLSYLKGFLRRYSSFSGTPTLLVSRDGFVMLSGFEAMPISHVDLSQPRSAGTRAQGQGRVQPLVLGDRTWLPVSSDESVLGARIVTLLPAEQLQPIRQVLIMAGALVLLLWAAIFFWKNRRLGRQLFDPVAQFALLIEAEERRLRQGELATQAPAPDSAAALAAPTRFRELAALQASFGRLIEAITERDQSLRQAREREKRNEERQRQLLQSKLHSSLMAASVAHEINLPLATIRMLCRQASSQLGQPDPNLPTSTATTTATGMNGVIATEELVASLSKQSQQASSVVNRMRMLLRNVQTDPQPTDPVAVLRGACRSVKPLLREQAVALDICGLEPPPRAVLLGDAVQLQMAVSNLLRNAIEAVAELPPGRRKVRLGLIGRGDELVVEVADSGPGFGFEPSGDTVLQTSKPNGSGLGLFVVRTTLEHHHGRLSFGRCLLLGGARVRMHLPLREVLP